MKIAKVITAPGLTGFYFDDQKAIKKDALHDGFAYLGEVQTEGFTSIRQAGEAISIMLVLDNGEVAHGDCAAVQYSGAGGRDPLFLAEQFIPLIEEEIAPQLIGRQLNSFRELAEEFDILQIAGKRLHTAIRYGLSQAFLDAVARAKKKTMVEVIVEEYGLDLVIKPIPIFAQTGDERYHNADKMIIKRVDVLPHGLINNVREKLGENGEILLEYVKWLRDRIQKMSADNTYQPKLHLDVYGTIGLAFKNDFEKIAAYFGELVEAAKPFSLSIEGPIDSGSRKAQIADMKKLRTVVREKGIDIQLVADEWCNTLEDIKCFVKEGAADIVQIKTPDLGGINNVIEAVLFCKEYGVGAYQGGTCNETDRSSQVCVNVALAVRPDQMLAKPGMGVDEGLMIVKNEMERVLALLREKNS